MNEFDKNADRLVMTVDRIADTVAKINQKVWLATGFILALNIALHVLEKVVFK